MSGKGHELCENYLRQGRARGIASDGIPTGSQHALAWKPACGFLAVVNSKGLLLGKKMLEFPCLSLFDHRRPTSVLPPAPSFFFLISFEQQQQSMATLIVGGLLAAAAGGAARAHFRSAAASGKVLSPLQAMIAGQSSSASKLGGQWVVGGFQAKMDKREAGQILGLK